MKVKETGGELLDVGPELHCMNRERLEIEVKIKNSCLSMDLSGQTQGWNGVGATCHFQGRKKERGLNPKKAPFQTLSTFFGH